jgi:hypothetical protein
MIVIEKLKPDVKVLFINALRSGEYPQASNRLKRPSGYCCLGVLTDLYIKSFPDKGKWVDGIPYFKRGEEFVNGDMHYLSKEVREWAGEIIRDVETNILIANLPSPEDYTDLVDREGRKFSQLNDRDKACFLEIANITEQDL